MDDADFVGGYLVVVGEFPLGEVADGDDFSCPMQHALFEEAQELVEADEELFVSVQAKVGFVFDGFCFALPS